MGLGWRAPDPALEKQRALVHSEGGREQTGWGGQRQQQATWAHGDKEGVFATLVLGNRRRPTLNNDLLLLRPVSWALFCQLQGLSAGGTFFHWLTLC